MKWQIRVLKYPVLCLVAQSCLTLYSLIDCSPPGSSLHGISQARILEWVAMPSSRGSSQARDRSQVSCIAGGFFTICASREALEVSCLFEFEVLHSHTPKNPSFSLDAFFRWADMMYAFSLPDFKIPCAIILHRSKEIIVILCPLA